MNKNSLLATIKMLQEDGSYSAEELLLKAKISEKGDAIEEYKKGVLQDIPDMFTINKHKFSMDKEHKYIYSSILNYMDIMDEKFLKLQKELEDLEKQLSDVKNTRKNGIKALKLKIMLDGHDSTILDEIKQVFGLDIDVNILTTKKGTK